MSSDLMGIVINLPKVDSIKIIVPGEELGGRRGDKKLIAITKARVTLKSEAEMSAFVQALIASDEALSKIPASEKSYEWEIALRQGLTVYFGVAWYDREFFDKRKDAFRSPQHAGLFATFGATAADFEVEHFVRIE